MAGTEMIGINGMSENRTSFGGKSGLAAQLLAAEAAMDDSSVGAPDQAALPDPHFKGLLVLCSPKIKRRDAVVIEQNAWLATGKHGQQLQQSVVLTIFHNDQIGRREESPVVRVGFRHTEDPAMRTNNRVQAPV